MPDIRAWAAVHRGPVTIGLFGLVAVLVAIAIWMGSGLVARDDGVAAVPTGTASAPQSSSMEPTDAPTSGPPEPTLSPSEAPAGSLADGWTEVASFGAAEGIEAVNDVVQAPFGLLAGGVQVDTRSLPVFGPIPEEGRVWLSTDDGQSWADVTPAETFENAEIVDLVVLPDGAVVAIVRVQVMVNGNPDTDYVALESSDGRTWTDARIDAGPAPILSIAAGGRGYLATIGVELGEPNLMYSADGRNYQRTTPAASGRFIGAAAAGPEGFVVLGHIYESAEPPTAYASADGLTWYEAAPSDWNALHLASIGPDWIAISIDPTDGFGDGHAPTSFSSNGLGWQNAGAIPLQAVELDATTTCREYASRAIGAGELVVASTTLSGPCGEGHVQRFGTSHITGDGDEWEALPFTGMPADMDITVARGVTVNGGIDLEAGTLLVGEKDYHATFWLRRR